MVEAPVVKLTDSWLKAPPVPGVQLLTSDVPVPLTPIYTYDPFTQPLNVYLVFGLTLTVWVHCASSELDTAPMSARLPLWTGLDTTEPRLPVQVHGERLPLSKPGLLTLFPPPPEEPVGDADGEEEGDELGEFEGEEEGEDEGDVEGDVEGEVDGVGEVQLAAEPLMSLTASLNSVAAGSRSYSENIMNPP